MKHLVNPLDRRPPTEIKPIDHCQPRRLYPRPTQITMHFMQPCAQSAARPHRQLNVRTDRTPLDAAGTPSDTLEVTQLRRLADAMLSKNHDDLEALAANNPALVKEWQDAFRAQSAAAEINARFWASAAAVLATAKGFPAASCRKKSTH